MRFALLGNHPDGLEMVYALIESGRHQLVAFSAVLPEQYHARVGAEPRLVSDLEELLADPAIELVIVAGNAANRGPQLRRALQSERHVLCVHPPESTPELAYEANMIRDDTHMILFPLLPDALHPGVQQLAELSRTQDGALGPISLFHLEIHATGEALLPGALPHKPCFPGWDVLRFVGGEIAEVSALSPVDTVDLDRQVLVNGRFVSDVLFQASFFPGRPNNHWRLSVQGKKGWAELMFPQGKSGPAYLARWDLEGKLNENAWTCWDPWVELVTVLDGLLRQGEDIPGRVLHREGEAPAEPVVHREGEAPAEPVVHREGEAPAEPVVHREGEAPAEPVVPARQEPRPPQSGGYRLNRRPSWQDVIRALELDDAVRRSVEKRRATVMEYPDATEEAGFKGTMTLVGCAMLWLLLLVLIAANWFPKLFWLIAPLLAIFLGLQVFRWALKDSALKGHNKSAQGNALGNGGNASAKP